jgi:hypothetical protein
MWVAHDLPAAGTTEERMTSQNMDEEQLAALALGGVLTSAMMSAAEGPSPRAWLYVWERDGLRWLIRFIDRRPDGRMDSEWTRSFLELNREAILSEGGKMDFNLRAARLAKAAQGK